MSNWQKARESNTLGQSGEFGELLMAKILDCKLSKDRVLQNGELRKDYSDIYNEVYGFRVEVKATGNKHPFYIRLKQLRFNGEWKHLPQSIMDTFYALVSYKSQTSQKRMNGKVRKNRNGGQKNGSPLTGLPMKYDRIRFMAEKTDEIYLLDRKIILRLAKILPVKQDPLPGDRHGACIVAYRERIREILRDSAIEKLVGDLHLRARDWTREVRIIDSVVVVDGHEHVVSCRLITILPKETHERIAQVIRFRAPSGNA